MCDLTSFAGLGFSDVFLFFNITEVDDILPKMLTVPIEKKKQCLFLDDLVTQACCGQYYVGITICLYPCATRKIHLLLEERLAQHVTAAT